MLPRTLLPRTLLPRTLLPRPLLLTACGLLACNQLACNPKPPTVDCALPAPIPLASAEHRASLGGGLPDFHSPYLGQTGSWNGTGGDGVGGDKLDELELEASMGLKWTFMMAHWAAFEPDGPVEPGEGEAWAQMDRFVLAVEERGMNLMMQPVVGGNGGGPPEWAGEVEGGQSAPEDMEALLDFVEKLAIRYSPGSEFLTEAGVEGWGVLAWELDNEPSSYRTNWGEQPELYAAFYAGAAERVHGAHPDALVAGMALAAGSGNYEAWLPEVLAAPEDPGSHTDLVTFHSYPRLDSFFEGDRPTECVVADVLDVWGAAGFSPEELWHTEGNYDFVGRLTDTRRAYWRWQWMTSLFSLGVRKLTIKDVADEEVTAMQVYVEELPDPFPMLPANAELGLSEDEALVFRHPRTDGATVWVLWAPAYGDDVVVELPVSGESARQRSTEGEGEVLRAEGGVVRVALQSKRKFSPPLMVIDEG